MRIKTGVESRYVISWCAVTLGILLGTVFLLLVAPVMLFTIGKNDSLPEVIGGAALCLSMLPASLLAIYKRSWAGAWLTLVGLYFAIAAAWNQYAVLKAHAITVSLGEVVGNGLLGIIASIFGLFFLVTAWRDSPSLRGGTRVAQTPQA